MSARARGVVERSLSSFVDALRHTFEAGKLAKRRGLLQCLDPRVKIAAILPLIVTAALARQLRVIAALFLLAVALAMLSRVPLALLAKKVWIAILSFTGLIAAPAIFLTPGRAVYTLPLIGWSITESGLRAAQERGLDRCHEILATFKMEDDRVACLKAVSAQPREQATGAAQGLGVAPEHRYALGVDMNKTPLRVVFDRLGQGS